ncbi:uncharacterized protein LOC114522346 [Dendronephthya gigantea]|uniref:uncharacterized protein LOC114522346 n=1 Tax=Dendronephthya gigantea TaxID=151771 RepID=UPI00106BC785|nr:uncharacterized protein LOC114522346 [Dendronephthya gigantea]
MEVEESGMSDCAVNDCEAEINTKSDEITSKIQSMPTMQKGPSRDKDTSSRYVMGKKKGNRTLRKLKRPFRSGLRTSTSDRFLHEESSVKKIVSLFATKPSYNEGSQFRKGKRELDLSNKNLNSSKISDMVAEGHCTVRKLNLSNCRLTYLPEALNSCFKLEELDLSHNPLNYPSPSCLPIQSLCNLKKLDLSDCHLTEIPFAFPPNLQELNLSHNNLDYQADLLEYLNRKKKSGKAVVSKSGKESEHMTRILELSKLKKLIIFEDNVYTKSRFGGVWTLKSHQEPVLFSKLMSTDRTSLQGEVKESGMPDWIVNDCQPCEEVTRLDEFCRIRKSDEITVETYRSMLQSLNIVCCLLNTNGETTLNRSCGKIFYELNDISGNDQFSHKMEGCRSNLQRGVSFLGRWSIRGDDHEFTLENSGKVFWNAFESARIPSVESLTMADQIISTKLRITSEILRNLALPSAAVLGCLNLLQELHDQQEVQTALSFVANGKAVSIHERAHFENVISIFKLNKILYDFTLTFAKSPPFAEDWPATIKLAERTYNPLTQKRWLKEQLEASSITMRLIGLIDIESQTQVIHDHAARYNGPVIESSGMSRNNSSITIGEAGGCFSIPIASGCLIFPPQDFDEPKTMEISRVRYEECEVKPKDGEVFVSRILEIKPKGVTFKKPVTVFISHSAYEDQIFLDFYELVIGRLNPAGWQELKTERISSIEDVPKEILNPEALEDYLPCAQATIQETCALVAVTRIRSEMIFVPTNRSYTFSKAYGNNAELRMTFPAGVTKEILCLKVQLIPVDTIVNTDAYRDQNLIRGPVIKVSGQKVPFLKPVEVELTYSHCDVANIDEDVLPVGTKTKMTAMYGFLLHKHKVTDSELRSEIINETNEVYIERQRKDQLRFFFSVQHFSDIQPVVSTTKRESYIPPMSISGATNINLQRYNAIVLAVHKTGCSPATLHAILAPREALKNIKDKWNVTNEYRKFEKPLRFREPVYFCVPWSNDNQLDHLPLENHTLRFDPDLELESELHNNTEEGINLKGKDMRFLQKECHDGKNHSTQGDCRAVAPIYTSSISSVQGVDRNVNATSPTFTQRQDDVENKILSTVNDTKIKSQKEGVDRNVNATSPTFTQRQDDAENKTLSTVNDAEIKSQKEDMKDNLHRCELFEEEIEKKFLEKLGINRGNIQNPIDGVTAKTLADAGAVSSIALGIAGGVTIILGISTFGVTSFALAAMTGVTFTVSKVNKRLKKSNAKKLNEKVKLYLHSHLKCIILDVAKELSRMFEYQVQNV